ncbi:MAG: hypothetical protein ACLGSD_05700 [Acidobacteriota bacterium]
MRALLVVLLAGAASLGAQATPGGKARTYRDLPVTLSASKLTPLQAILRIAAENRIPLGIVVGTRPSLCGSHNDFNIHEAGAWDAFEEVVAGTGYEVTFEDNVFVIRAPDTTEHEVDLLHHRFERFGTSGKDTISGAGEWLSGYILTVEGASGIGGEHMFDPDEPTVTIKMEEATTEQIANRIVSSGDKGVWVFRPTPEGSTTTSAIETLAYKWNQHDLDRAGCEDAFAAVP